MNDFLTIYGPPVPKSKHPAKSTFLEVKYILLSTWDELSPFKCTYMYQRGEHSTQKVPSQNSNLLKDNKLCYNGAFLLFNL